jgi:hypothetical protein
MNFNLLKSIGVACPQQCGKKSLSAGSVSAGVFVSLVSFHQENNYQP